ncbi:MAG: hypothetical protein ACKO8U_15255, partial [Pirellula sp.]
MLKRLLVLTPRRLDLLLELIVLEFDKRLIFLDLLAMLSAPLNPAYRADEFEFYLSDLKSKALIVEKGSDTPAIEVAKKLGVTLLEL